MLLRNVQIKPSRNPPEQTSTGYPSSPRSNLHEIVRSNPPHAIPDCPETTCSKSSGANLVLPSHIVKINLYEIARSKPPHAASDRPDKTFAKSSGANLHMLPRIAQINLHEIVRSKLPHGTPHRPATDFTESSGATSTCQPGSSK